MALNEAVAIRVRELLNQIVVDTYDGVGFVA